MYSIVCYHKFDEVETNIWLEFRWSLGAVSINERKTLSESSRDQFSLEDVRVDYDYN